MSALLKKIGFRILEINGNKNPVRMDEFMSFLTVQVKRSHDHLGSDNGWTKLIGENNFEITGGIVGGVEYLDSIQYGKKLHNEFNNYVNPFHIFEILTEEGKQFFINYYKPCIEKMIQDQKNVAQYEINKRDDLVNFWGQYGFK